MDLEKKAAITSQYAKEFEKNGKIVDVTEEENADQEFSATIQKLRAGGIEDGFVQSAKHGVRLLIQVYPDIHVGA